jgi:hypothetical protein
MQLGADCGLNGYLIVWCSVLYISSVLEDASSERLNEIESN